MYSMGMVGLQSWLWEGLVQPQASKCHGSIWEMVFFVRKNDEISLKNRLFFLEFGLLLTSDVTVTLKINMLNFCETVALLQNIHSVILITKTCDIF